MSLVFCGISYQGWESLYAWLICACVTYLIIELNTTFALIRTRTTLPSSFFLVCFSVCPFLHTFGTETFLPLLFIGMLFSLFKSFESPYASTTIYHAFCSVGIIGIIIPQTLYLTPVLYLHLLCRCAGTADSLLVRKLLPALQRKLAGNSPGIPPTADTGYIRL